MAFKVKILADSVAPHGKRLTTFELTYGRIFHSEVMTHRMFSRNAASSRAIPVEKMLQRIMDDPFVPSFWGKNQKGMQATRELSIDEQAEARRLWLVGRDEAVATATKLKDLGLHKQVVNRVVEPWMWITVILSGTEWNNFWFLRDSAMAEPHFEQLAREMRTTFDASRPEPLWPGQWHLPLVISGEQGIDGPDLVKVSTGRVARVSYLTHDGKRDPATDVALHDQLLKDRHMSPFEHVATPATEPFTWSGNFQGWVQYRKTITGENVEG